MRIWLVTKGSHEDMETIAAVDDDHLGKAIHACKALPDVHVDLNSPLSLNVSGWMLDNKPPPT